MIEKSERATFLRSIDGIVEAVRIDHHDDNFYAPRLYFYEQERLTLLTVNNKKRDELVKISGRIDGNGYVHVDDNGNIFIENICSKKYCANGPEEKVEITDNKTGETPSLNKEDPVITLNGDSTIYVELNGTYKELGATARTKGGDSLEYTTEIKKNNGVVDYIDTTIEGTYVITYETSNNEKTVSVERTVAVLNMRPVITMTESNETYVKEKSVFISVSEVRPNKVTGFRYEIKRDGELLSQESVIGLTKTLTLNETGIYEVIATVSDNNNHTNTLSKTYKIDSTKPTIEVPENTVIKMTEVTTYNILEGITVKDNVDLSPEIETRGSLTATLGEQSITYIARDGAGNEETVTRKFTVVEAEGPILNFSNVGSEIWTQDQTITVTATDNSNLKTFTYEVIKDGVSKGVTNVEVSGKSATASVSLNESGIYSIKLTGSDEYGNTTTLESGEYKIDVTKPIFTAKSTEAETIMQGASNVIESTYFNSVTWSISGEGNVACKSGSTTVTNTSTLAVGTHEITCTATGQNGLSTSASKTIVIKAPIVDTTGANKPSLSNGLIPIKWNGSAWIRADSENGSGSNQWYDYSSQMWANAASVTEEYRNVSVGEEIPESAINAYFVWIPRYEYQYTNLGTSYAGGSKSQPGGININFIATSKTSPSTNYKIHPAFTFGSTQLAGFWVGKFETTGDAGAPTIKPNLSSLRNQNVSTQFATAQKFSASGNSYGISTSADAHMMKNSEWGAVAYLSQSKYGKYGNSSYTGANKEVYQNKSDSYITGCSNGAPSSSETSSCTNAYNVSPGGTGASTTGTIYGVYDMSGGAFEYVMGVYNSSVRSSGFSSLPASKYYDNYTSTSVTTACNSGICYGHALSETSGWYSDSVTFVASSLPWYERGGSYSYTTSNAGVFCTYIADGGARSVISFRVVMLG